MAHACHILTSQVHQQEDLTADYGKYNPESSLKILVIVIFFQKPGLAVQI